MIVKQLSKKNNVMMILILKTDISYSHQINL